MNKCQDEDLLKRPTASEILNIIKDWYIYIKNENIYYENISNELKNAIDEYYSSNLIQSTFNIVTSIYSHSSL